MKSTSKIDKNTIENIENSLEKAYSYTDYEDLIESLLAENKSTTKDADEDFVHYSKLGIRRMKRWDKTFKINDEQKEKIKKYDKEIIWIVLSEGWCGDAAHSLPIINKITEENEFIDLKIVLREENLDLMNDFLTNGGKSIPKLIAYNSKTKTVEGTWGPRPKPAQDIFLEARKNGVDFETYEQDLQKWYNKDKGQTATAELLKLLEK